MLVLPQATGLVSLLANESTFATRKFQMTNGIAELQKDNPFRVWVANFSSKPQHLRRHMQIGITSAAHEIIHHRIVESAEPEITESVLTITMKRLKETFEYSGIRHQIVEAVSYTHLTLPTILLV